MKYRILINTFGIPLVGLLFLILLMVAFRNPDFRILFYYSLGYTIGWLVRFTLFTPQYLIKLKYGGEYIEVSYLTPFLVERTYLKKAELIETVKYEPSASVMVYTDKLIIKEKGRNRKNKFLIMSNPIQQKVKSVMNYI